MNALPALKSLGLMLLGMTAFVVVVSLVQVPMRSLHVPVVIEAPIIIVVALAGYVAWVRFVERRRVTELDPAPAARAVLGGLVFGISLFTVVVATLALLHVFAVTAFGSWLALAGVVAAFGTAVVEEILFRGWLFRTVRDVGGTWIAVAVSALVFGLLHAFNPGASATSTIAVALEAGVMLALAYAVTNRLWLPIGIHAGWNFAEGSIFGTPVSGTTTKVTLLQGTLHGPVTLTGGVFGVEASVVAIVVCLLVAIVFATRLPRGQRPRAAATAA